MSGNHEECVPRRVSICFVHKEPNFGYCFRAVFIYTITNQRDSPFMTYSFDDGFDDDVDDEQLEDMQDGEVNNSKVQLFII